MPPKLKKEKVEIGGKEITIKKEGLHRSLKVPDSYTFKVSELKPLKKIEIGKEFTFHGKKIKMTDLVKKRIVLGINLMTQGRKKK